MNVGRKRRTHAVLVDEDDDDIRSRCCASLVLAVYR